MIDGYYRAAWQELGFTGEYLDAAAQNITKTADLWLRVPPSALGEHIESWVFLVCTDGTAVFAMGSMGYMISYPPLDNWREMGRRVVSASLHYFFGNWRERFLYFGEEYDLARSRTMLVPWINAYRRGLMMALCLSDWTSADRLLAWPGADLHFDEGVDNQSQEDNAYQVWLASQLRGESVAAGAAHFAVVTRGKRRRPKMLVTAAQALLDDDGKAFTKSLIAYLRYHRQHELKPSDLFSGISVDAAVLWHVARRRRLQVDEVPHELMLLIPRP